MYFFKLSQVGLSFARWTAK